MKQYRTVQGDTWDLIAKSSTEMKKAGHPDDEQFFPAELCDFPCWHIS